MDDGSPSPIIHNTAQGDQFSVITGGQISVDTPKAWQLHKGNTVFNNPGAMQSLLIAMADRWDPNLGRRTIGVDEKSGFGRLKLRLLDQVVNGGFIPTAFSYQSYSFTSSSPSISYYAWNTPMPVGTDFVKCVMFEPEDMSSKSGPIVSDLYLQMNLRDPDSNGNCTAYSPYYYGYGDGSYDLRHMTASQGSQNIGRCLQVTISKGYVTSVGASAHVFCYRAGVRDYEDVP